MKKPKKSKEKTEGYSPRIVVQFEDYVDLPYEDGVEKYFEKLKVIGQKETDGELFKKLNFNRLYNAIDAKKIETLVHKAMEMDNQYKPANLLSYFVVECPNGMHPEKLETYLNRWPSVKKAYLDPPGSEPLVSPDTNPRFINQGYLDPAPDGIDIEFAWPRAGGVGFNGGDGAGISVIDLERGWTFDHEDLNSLGISLLHGDIRDGSRAHGTSVFGEICAVDNAIGCVGITPGIASANAVSYWNSNRPNAIVAAIDNLNFGDVLLLEAQLSITGWSNMPIEVLDAEYETIRLATALGIVVIEAAGNGGNDMDTYTDSGGNAIFNRSNAGFRDSGAIMVGASSSAVPHTRMGFSNFGSRIDCYAWGENVNTASSNSSGNTTAYTGTFNGTSSASPIITGAAIAVQGIAEANLGYRFSPFQMRTLLSDSASGTPSANPATDRIGVMPNLRAILTSNTLNLSPDIYIRDNIGDIGDPHNGSISSSPDIIVRPSTVPDPVGAFGEGSGTENSAILGFEVEAGQDNFIYTRIRNRGGSAAPNVNATLYWSQVSTLVTPDLWNLIGSITVPNVPTGNILTVSDALAWPSAEIPATGHYCFVGLVNHPQDQAPGPADFMNWDNFRSFIKDNNNVAWRNFNVVDNEPNTNFPFIELPFLVPGAFDRTRIMELEINGKLPKGSRLLLELPTYWAEDINIPKQDLKEWKIKLPNLMKRTRIVPLSPSGSNIFGNLRLPAKSKSQLKIWVHIPKALRKFPFEVYARQLYKKEELGRVTWRLEPLRKKDIRRK